MKLQSLSGEHNSPLGKADTAGGEVVPAGVGSTERRLLEPHKAAYLLCLSDEEVTELVATGQIMPIRISGKDRFDSWDIDGLIGTYKHTAMRRAGSF